MDIISFFTNISSADFFKKNKTICFSGAKEHCPVLFFSLFLKHLKSVCSDSVQIIDCQQQELASICGQLATSFLGSSTIFWCTNIGVCKPKKKKQLLQTIKNYSGPNVVLFFADETVSFTKKDVDLFLQLPTKVDEKLFAKLAPILTGRVSDKAVRSLFSKSSAIDLDAACLLLQYLQLLGRNGTSFVQEWLHKLIEPEHSLQSLSGSLFANDKKKFFSLWKSLGKEYPPQFWISFWSEQLWRAFYFVQYSKRRQFIEAKRISYRLPYSFVNGNWRRCSADQLSHAHQLLYDIDCSLKNGGHERSLELVYTNFFCSQ